MTTEERIQKDRLELIKEIAEILRDNITMIPQCQSWSIHGAIEKIMELMAARNKENAIAFLTFREKYCIWVSGTDESENYQWTTDLPGYKGFYNDEQLYDLFIEQNKKV